MYKMLAASEIHVDGKILVATENQVEGKILVATEKQATDGNQADSKILAVDEIPASMEKLAELEK